MNVESYKPNELLTFEIGPVHVVVGKYIGKTDVAATNTTDVRVVRDSLGFYDVDSKVSIHNDFIVKTSIKDICEAAYNDIREAEKALEIARKECTHENTHVGNYSWRVGCIDEATLCSDCGELIKLF
jgi:hypothetical protein